MTLNVIGELVKAAGKREKWKVDLTISEREQARTKFNQQGGQVTIINPPFASERPKRKNWKRSFRILKYLYITFSNGRVKNRNTPSDHPRTHEQAFRCRERKGKLYERQQGICPECGQHFAINQMEYHHILPWARFPELRGSIRNAVMLCHKCHKEVHCNPWRNIEMMKAKAEELGIDLKERYDYEEGI